MIWWQVGQFQFLLVQPLAVGPFSGEFHFQFFVRHQASGKEIHQEHFARLQTSFFFHVLRRNRQHANLRRHNDFVIVGQVIARGTQAVAIQYCADVVAVGEHDRGRAIPGLHQRGVVLVEIAFFFGHVDVGLPGFGHHHHDGFLQRAAGHQQKLEHIVEGAGV